MVSMGSFPTPAPPGQAEHCCQNKIQNNTTTETTYKYIERCVGARQVLGYPCVWFCVFVYIRFFVCVHMCLCVRVGVGVAVCVCVRVGVGVGFGVGTRARVGVCVGVGVSGDGGFSAAGHICRRIASLCKSSYPCVSQPIGPEDKDNGSFSTARETAYRFVA